MDLEKVIGCDGNALLCGELQISEENKSNDIEHL